MCTYYLNHILMFYNFFNENKKRVVLYFEENEKAVVFDTFFVAIHIFNETEKKQRCLI